MTFKETYDKLMKIRQGMDLHDDIENPIFAHFHDNELDIEIIITLGGFVVYENLNYDFESKVLEEDEIKVLFDLNENRLELVYLKEFK